VFAGLDFGTTNSALAVADAAGNVQLTHYDVRGVTYDTFRSVLYFDPDARGRAVCGIEGIFAYLDKGAGRFIQSIKSHLASQAFRSTSIFNRTYRLEDLIALIVGQLKAKHRGELPDRVVVGRPVHFVNDADDPGGDELAESRLREAIAMTGFRDIVFVEEPVAAAYQYESGIARDELVLIADFGGGTTDFCVLDVGPSARRKGTGRVRATDGVGLAGDAFDQRIIQHAIAPALGWGGKYRVFGGDADVPLWLYRSLARWHLLSFLKSQKTMQLLDEIVANAYDKRSVEALYRIVDEDLGYALHRAVERAKVELTTEPETTIDFDDGAIVRTIRREELEQWIAEDLARIEQALGRVLASAGVAAGEIDRVFLTGGTSLVPAVRRLFRERFGEKKLRGGEEMTSVVRGLALAARDAFA
jgi:hypothetical chaperone protein